MSESSGPETFVEETSTSRSSFDGAATSTTGFVGPARFGPVGSPSPALNSLQDFERIYGDGQALSHGVAHNYLWHAARAFFEEGGRRLHVVRLYRATNGDGHARASIGFGSSAITLRARFPGAAGNMTVHLVLEHHETNGVTAKLTPADLPVDVTVGPEFEFTAGAAVSFNVALAGGDDGARPVAGDYTSPGGIAVLAEVPEISLVAAPGATAGYNSGFQGEALEILQSLVAHASSMRYRFAILDCGDNQTIESVRELRRHFDSSYAALYYPWVRMLDPVTETLITLPPSGFVTGIYARTDSERGVHEAPANEAVRLAAGFEKSIGHEEQDILNPEGINCFRFFPGRGSRLFGARTVSSDSEWKYVNVRRLCIFIEQSIEMGTQWAVFEQNRPELWTRVRDSVSDFLRSLWSSGVLLGTRPEEAFFVRCDRTTMTQDDLDNGRLIVLVGVAAVRPAEFIILRIGQKTLCD